MAAALTEWARGWNPYGDDSVVAWRAYDTFSHHLPLVGQFTQAISSGHPGYDLGPSEDWLLAVPVHLSPAHGALWGAALLCVIAASIGIEASWSVASWRGSLPVAAAFAMLGLTYSAVALDPIWNPYLGAVFLLATLVTGWAVASGHLAWLPALVAVASITVQSHLVYVWPGLAIAIAAVALAAAHITRIELRNVRGWIVFALSIGLALWIGPILQQLVGHPGNMSVLASGAPGPKTGFAIALRATWSFTRPFPSWWHSVVTPGAPGITLREFYGVILSGSAGSGLAVVILLGVVALVGLFARRRLLGSAAALSFVSVLATAWALAQLPTTQLSRLEYIDVILWPVGIAAWSVLVWALVEGMLTLSKSLRVRVRPWRRFGEHRLWQGVAGVGALGILAVGVLATNASVQATRTNPYRTESLALTAAFDHLGPRLAPHGPFTVQFQGQLPPALYPPSLIESVAYRLHVDGLDPRFAVNWQQIGPWVRPAPGTPELVLHLAPDGATSATLCNSEHVHCRTVSGASISLPGAPPRPTARNGG